MKHKIEISYIRNLLRSVNGYERNASAPSISRESDGSISIHFHQFHKINQSELAKNCEEKLKSKGFHVTNCYPYLTIES